MPWWRLAYRQHEVILALVRYWEAALRLQCALQSRSRVLERWVINRRARSLTVPNAIWAAELLPSPSQQPQHCTVSQAKIFLSAVTKRRKF